MKSIEEFFRDTLNDFDRCFKIITAYDDYEWRKKHRPWEFDDEDDDEDDDDDIPSRELRDATLNYLLRSVNGFVSRYPIPVDIVSEYDSMTNALSEIKLMSKLHTDRAWYNEFMKLGYAKKVIMVSVGVLIGFFRVGDARCSTNTLTAFYEYTVSGIPEGIEVREPSVSSISHRRVVWCNSGYGMHDAVFYEELDLERTDEED